MLLIVAWLMCGVAPGTAENQSPKLPDSAPSNITALAKLSGESFIAVYPNSQGVHAIMYGREGWSKPLTLSDTTGFLAASGVRIHAAPNGKVLVFWRQKSASAELCGELAWCRSVMFVRMDGRAISSPRALLTAGQDKPELIEMIQSRNAVLGTLLSVSAGTRQNFYAIAFDKDEPLLPARQVDEKTANVLRAAIGSPAVVARSLPSTGGVRSPKPSLAKLNQSLRSLFENLRTTHGGSQGATNPNAGVPAPGNNAPPASSSKNPTTCLAGATCEVTTQPVETQPVKTQPSETASGPSIEVIQPPENPLRSVCSNGRDDDGDGITDGPGVVTIKTTRVDPPSGNPKPIAAVGRYALASNLPRFNAGGPEQILRPMGYVFDVTSGANIGASSPLVQTANDNFIDEWQQYKGAVALQTRINRGKIPQVATCDLSKATAVYAISVYEGAPIHVKVNTGGCVALALSAYHSTNWVIETFNGSAIAAVLLHTYEGAKVFGAPTTLLTQVPPQSAQFYKGLAWLSFAKKRLNLQQGTIVEKYSARGFLLGKPDPTLSEAYWGYDYPQSWYLRDVVATPASALLFLTGIAFTGQSCKPSQPSVCANNPPRDREGYVVSWTPYGPETLRRVKLPSGLTDVGFATYDPSADAVYIVASGPTVDFQLLRINPRSLQVEAQTALYNRPGGKFREIGLGGDRPGTPLPYRVLARMGRISVLSRGREITLFDARELQLLYRGQISVSSAPARSGERYDDYGSSLELGGDGRELYVLLTLQRLVSNEPIDWRQVLVRIDPQTQRVVAELTLDQGKGVVGNGYSLVADNQRQRLVAYGKKIFVFDISAGGNPRLISTNGDMAETRYDARQGIVFGFRASDSASRPGEERVVGFDVTNGQQRDVSYDRKLRKYLDPEPSLASADPYAEYWLQRITERTSPLSFTSYYGVKTIVPCNP